MKWSFTSETANNQDQSVKKSHQNRENSKEMGFFSSNLFFFFVNYFFMLIIPFHLFIILVLLIVTSWCLVWLSCYRNEINYAICELIRNERSTIFCKRIIAVDLCTPPRCMKRRKMRLTKLRMSIERYLSRCFFLGEPFRN